jgi:hypothetical protein
MRFTGKGDWNLDPWLMDVLLRNSMAILYLLKEKKKKKNSMATLGFYKGV